MTRRLFNSVCSILRDRNRAACAKDTGLRRAKRGYATRRFAAPTSISLALALIALAAPSAQASFGINGFDATFTNPDGSPSIQAGSHPFAVNTFFNFNTTANPHFESEVPDQEPRDVVVQQIPGLVGDPGAAPTCPSAKFAFLSESRFGFFALPECPDDAVVGAAAVGIIVPGIYVDTPIYNLTPSPGRVAKVGFYVLTVPIIVEFTLKKSGEYNVIASSSPPQVVAFYGSLLQLWGTPSDPAHDPYRGPCVNGVNFFPASPSEFLSVGDCSISAPSDTKPFLTLPRSCTGPATTTYAADSWQNPGALLSDGEPDLTDPNWVTGSALTHDYAEPPNPQGFKGCNRLGFDPTITAKPTTLAADSPTGLDFSLDVNDEGLTNPKGIADSDIRKAEVTLPEGFTTNPSLAEGLNVCTEADLEAETLESAPGAGCPNESKIGGVELESPLIEESVNGALYIAKPYENPFHSLLGLYLVVKNPKLGIIVKQFLKVETDPETGQITTIADNIPQLPFSHFRLHFREGARSPLISPPACGEFSAKAVLTPSSGGESITTTSAFSIISGADNTPCPSAGTPPFHPELLAGTLNNAAGTYSPFDVRLDRRDGEQEITHFSIKLPPGVIGKLAGIPQCSDAAIAAAQARTGPHGGAEELAAPSCPAASELGHTVVGAGVGSALTYAPGKMYLAGPYHGAPLSIVAITAAKVGPFDLGTVVVRFALRINPETAEVFVDATGSDPIPHIIQGIPVHLRDIRAYVDRPEFVLNPTSCAKTSTASTVLGSGLDFVSAADDQPLVVSSPFQAADCASLPFKPKLKLSLNGATKRTGNPAFKARLTMKPGEANIARSVVTLPRSEFLDNSHIRTVCTKTVYNQGAVPGENCPSGSIYGHARATSPILDEPLEGPVFLRTPGGKLPDLVAALHSQKVNITLVGHIDSVRSKTKSGEAISRIRNTFAAVPDAPVSSFVLEMQGGNKGLLQNSTNLCRGVHRANVEFTGHNGKQANSTPAVSASCPKHPKKKHRRTRR